MHVPQAASTLLTAFMTLHPQSPYTVTKSWRMQTGKLVKRGFGVMGLSIHHFICMLHWSNHSLTVTIWDNDTPTHSGLHAECILYDLTHDFTPNAFLTTLRTTFLSLHLIKCLLQLQPGFSMINNTERAALCTHKMKPHMYTQAKEVVRMLDATERR